MGFNAEPFNPMKSRKRAHEDESFLAATKCQELEPSHSTSSPTTSPKYNPLSERLKARQQPSRASQSEPKPPKRDFGNPDCNRLTNKRRFFQDWLRNSCPSALVQEEAEGIEIIPTIERPSLQILAPDSQASSDQISKQDEEPAPAPPSAQSERLNTSSPMYRSTQKMNGIIIDNFGTKIPQDVQALVTKHIRKRRGSPRLGDDEQAKIIQSIEEAWDSTKPMVSDIIAPPLFPLNAPGTAQRRDALWSTKPVPRSSDHPHALPAPKTDRHIGFWTSLKSDWTREELAAADHPKVRPYSQPTQENLFPSLLFEVKSETTRDTLYEAESQLATAGAHRVSSLTWMLDQVDPGRSRSSGDALIFSAAVSQREAVMHVHYYNPEDKMFYMSYIDSFHFAKDVQGCRDHVKNVMDWLLEIQQPIIRNALKNLHPLTKVWKKGRPTTAITDAADSSFESE
ncbi:hypothetical protein ACQKWADRAFT_114158 [Trichoderma austrokoningii]